MQAPRSSTGAPFSMEIAWTGQALAQSWQPLWHFSRSMTGAPRNRSGRTGGFAGYFAVRWPCRALARSTFSIAASQVVSAVGEVEALVAEREVGDLLAAERQREPGPVVERGVHHLVAAQLPGGVGDRHVADRAAPPLDQR